MPGEADEPRPPPAPVVFRHPRQRAVLLAVKGCQTVATVVLLILASCVTSPRDPTRKQSQRSPQVPNPDEYQAFISLAFIRLLFQTFFRVWDLLRKRQRGRDALIEEAVEAAPVVPAPGPAPDTMPSSPRPAANASLSSVNQHPYSTNASVNRSTVTLGRSSLHQVYATPGAASSATSWVTAASPRSMSPTPEREGGSVSPAAHLYAIPDAATTLASLASIMPGNSGPSSPVLAQSSTLSTPNLHTVLAPEAARASTHSLPQGAERPVSTRITSITYPAPAAMSTTSLVPPPSRSTASLALPSHAGPSRSTASLSSPARPASRSTSRPPSRAYPESIPMATVHETPAANQFPEPYVSRRDRRSQRRAKVAKTIDQLADRATLWLQVFEWIMFIWACPLLAPLPGLKNSPYESSPLLWWAVGVVVITNWVYLAAIVAVGICGIIMIAVFYFTAIICRRMGWRYPLYEFGFNSATKLSKSDLRRLPIMCYLPHPDEPAPVPSIYGDGQSVRSGRSAAPEVQGSLVLPGQAEPSRLDIPAVELTSHQATCAICQSSFLAPRDVPGQRLYEVTRVRQLPCKHHFHVDCVDKWLLEHSNVCPYCNRNVKDMLEGTEKSETSTPRVDAV